MYMPSGLAPHLWISCLQSPQTAALFVQPLLALWGTCHGLNHFSHAKEASPLIVSTAKCGKLCSTCWGRKKWFMAAGWDADLLWNTRAPKQSRKDLCSDRAHSRYDVKTGSETCQKGYCVWERNTYYLSLLFISNIFRNEKADCLSLCLVEPTPYGISDTKNVPPRTEEPGATNTTHGASRYIILQFPTHSYF